MIAAQKQTDRSPIRNSSVFSADNLQKLQQMMHFQNFEENVNVFREGDAATSLYFIQSGKVKLTKLSEEGKEYIMSLFHGGDFFGQLDTSSRSVHPFTATTMEKCVVGALQRSDLEVLLWQHGDLAIEFVNWISFMHRLTQTKFRDLVMLGKPGALCSTLIRLSNTYGREDEDGIHITMKLTNAELADHIGCARESVNRILGELRRAGAVSMNDGMITITNLTYLQSICRCELCPKDLCRM
ncbi:Crp/Fnr family transcriptional regulator [Cohnella cellulosilytica]|uniref:Crp/Fnr family transcriptional regulator n=1 Tax=Cohnella cellulosilytica TaxID=986710 RepID=A0ABW2F1P0_9BACL